MLFYGLLVGENKFGYSSYFSRSWDMFFISKGAQKRLIIQEAILEKERRRASKLPLPLLSDPTSDKTKEEGRPGQVKIHHLTLSSLDQWAKQWLTTREVKGVVRSTSTGAWTDRLKLKPTALNLTPRHKQAQSTLGDSSSTSCDQITKERNRLSKF